jgi:anti-sigma factor RsiW
MHSDPMLTKLGAYLDAELPSGEAAAVPKHIGSCPQCAAEIASLATLQRSLRVVRGHFTPSVEFQRRIQRQIGAPPRHWSLSWIPLAIAAAIGWIERSRRSDAFAEVADLHVNNLNHAPSYAGVHRVEDLRCWPDGWTRRYPFGAEISSTRDTRKRLRQ